MVVEDVAIKDIIFAEYNPRRLSKEQEKSLTDSLSTFGFVDPVIVNKHPERKNILVGGHQRVKVWQKLGHENVPVVFVDLDRARERELNVRLNKNLGDWDWDILQENFSPSELISWGFNDKELFGRFRNKTVGDDDAPGLSAGAPKAKRGDVYDLGAHRVMCGDGTSQEDLEKLMVSGQNVTMADMVFTDPPYNVNYSGRGKDTSRTIENDNMSQEAFRAFLNAVFAMYRKWLKPAASLYCCYASRTHREFEDALNQNEFEVSNQIIWVKLVASMGWGHYRWKHEPILFCRRAGQETNFYGDRKQYTTWEEAQSEEELVAKIKARITKEEAGNSTVWRFNRESNYVHPTQKPVDLVSRAILNSSVRGGAVLDLFLGSGSTLISCEKEDRVCFGMELDPAFVDVIVKRYVDFCKKNGRPYRVVKNGEEITN